MPPNFLDHYFLSVFRKLEADALLFNKKIPHAATSGAENESVIANILREFLPPRFGVEVGGLVIDRHGGVSKQSDIIIYDSQSYPKYFRKIFPVEVVLGIIEVKTAISKKGANDALSNLETLNSLDFRPALTPYWLNKTKNEQIHHSPPFCAIFSYTTNSKAFETFVRWFPWEFLNKGVNLKEKAPKYPEVRTLTVCSLDQGLIEMASTNKYINRIAAISDKSAENRSFKKKINKKSVYIDPAKSLFLFLESMWTSISTHKIHPGFDIRSYLSESMDVIMKVEDI
jgi:hypothetical protein